MVPQEQAKKRQVAFGSRQAWVVALLGWWCWAGPAVSLAPDSPCRSELALRRALASNQVSYGSGRLAVTLTPVGDQTLLILRHADGREALRRTLRTSSCDDAAVAAAVVVARFVQDTVSLDLPPVVEGSRAQPKPVAPSPPAVSAPLRRSTGATQPAVALVPAESNLVRPKGDEYVEVLPPSDPTLVVVESVWPSHRRRLLRLGRLRQQRRRVSPQSPREGRRFRVRLKPSLLRHLFRASLRKMRGSQWYQ